MTSPRHPSTAVAGRARADGPFASERSELDQDEA